MEQLEHSLDLVGGKVYAEVIVTGRHVAIYSLSSHEQGQGNAFKALRDLRGKFGAKTISAHDVGDPGTQSHAFWVHAKERGLVNSLYDDLDQLICEEPLAPARPPILPFSPPVSDHDAGQQLNPAVPTR